MIWNHPIEPSIYKWLFGVPGIYLYIYVICICRFFQIHCVYIYIYTTKHLYIRKKHVWSTPQDVDSSSPPGWHETSLGHPNLNLLGWEGGKSDLEIVRWKLFLDDPWVARIPGFPHLPIRDKLWSTWTSWVYLWLRSEVFLKHQGNKGISRGSLFWGDVLLFLANGNGRITRNSWNGKQLRDKPQFGAI